MESNTFWTNILNLPSEFWAAFLTSAVTSLAALIGVCMTIKSNQKNLANQLKHDAEEKEKERMAILHREVYLKLSKEIAQLFSHLGSLSQVDLIEKNIFGNINEFFSASAQAQLISKNDTAIILADFNNNIGVFLIKILPKITEINIINGEINLETKKFNDLFRKLNNLHDERMLLVRKETTDSYLSIEMISKQIKFYEEIMNDSHMKLETLGKNHIQKSKEVSFIILDELKELLPLQLKIHIALRKELGLPSDIYEYEKHIERSWNEITTNFKQTIKDIKNQCI